MPEWGMLVTVAVSLIGCATFLLAARAVRPGGVDTRKRWDLFIWYICGAAFLFFAGGRIVFGYLGLYVVDEALFLLAAVPAYLSIIPLVHLTGSLLSERPIVAWVATAMAAGVAVAGLLPFFAAGIRGPEVGFWATEWRFNSLQAAIVLIVGVLLPAVVAGMVIVGMARQMPSPTRQRMTAVGWSILVYYVALTSDGLALSGGTLIVERGLMALAAAAVVRAHTRYGRTQLQELAA